MKKVLLFGVMLLTLGSCLKLVDYPNRPHVEYLNHVFVLDSTSIGQTLGYVEFRFTDGDGDLGLNQGDTFGVHQEGQPYYYNLFVRYFEKQNGTYEEIFGASDFHVRFENLTPSGADKTLEGTMAVDVFNSGTGFDTVRYEMYIVDRALQHSDTMTTPDIILPF